VRYPYLALALMDTLRQIQGHALEQLGLGPTECRYRIAAAGRRWRLRAYGGAIGGPPLLIVAAPIKRPYIWDLGDPGSVVRYCLQHRLRVYLLEWLPPSSGDNAGLADYAKQSIGEAVTGLAQDAGVGTPFIMGHSLGGTLAAIFAAIDAPRVRGLVLLSTPLCFEPGSSRFRDALVVMAPPSLSAMEVVPGSLLTQLSMMASPETFLWSRLIDAALSVGDPRALELHARVERWALDEFPLPGGLVDEILQLLHRENRFCDGTLQIREKVVGPSSLQLPVLAVVNTADAIAPPRSIVPCLNAMPRGYAHVIKFPGEIGVALQHLAILVGREAFAAVWPKIISWLHNQP
jgi:polyhydroxyalkanoate synthase subunit PhaC